MDFYLATLRFLTDLAVNAKSCLNSNATSILHPIIPPIMPLPRQIRSVVMHELLIGSKSGSAIAETTHMMAKYAVPAAIPHKNLRFDAPFEKSIPAKSDEIQ